MNNEIKIPLAEDRTRLNGIGIVIIELSIQTDRDDYDDRALRNIALR